jgi:hypothetical protein
MTEYDSGFLDEARSTVVEDFGEVPLVTLDFFMKTVLPPVDSSVLRDIKAALVAKKHIKKDHRWSAMPKNPSQTGKRETEAFQTFPTLIKHIDKAASPFMNSEPTLEFVYKPNGAPVSERNNESRPDGQLELKTKRSLGERSSSRRTRSKSLLEKSRWEDIVLPCEFKLHEKDYADVRSFRDTSRRFIITLCFY